MHVSLHSRLVTHANLYVDKPGTGRVVSGTMTGNNGKSSEHLFRKILVEYPSSE